MTGQQYQQSSENTNRLIFNSEDQQTHVTDGLLSTRHRLWTEARQRLRFQSQ